MVVGMAVRAASHISLVSALTAASVTSNDSRRGRPRAGSNTASVSDETNEFLEHRPHGDRQKTEMLSRVRHVCIDMCLCM